jgi:addiction module HigA family antidote
MEKVLAKNGASLRTPVAFHPGQFLLEEVEERGLKKLIWQKSLGILPGNLGKLFKGRHHINARMAVRLEKILNISAEYWIGLQTTYDLTLARELEHV